MANCPRRSRAIERIDATFRRADAADVPIEATPDSATREAFRRGWTTTSTPRTRSAGIFEAARAANRAIDDGGTARAAELLRAVRELLAVLGLEVVDPTTADDDEIDTLVRARDEARAARDFARADELRDELAARGIKLEDTPGGTIWHR